MTDTPNTTLLQFAKALTALDSPPDIDAFLGAFLSETEYSVLAKRFEVLQMIAEGSSYSQMSAQTGVSSATISSISKLSEDPAVQKLLLHYRAESWAEEKAEQVFSFLRGKTEIKLEETSGE
ncbi:MAG: hypothetical protein H6774_01650 [Pseudomonadales bacterium]|nr:hypothetical protein [Pseudomonadales bacterium]